MQEAPYRVQALLEAIDSIRDRAAEEMGRLRIAAVYQGSEVDCLPILFDVPAHDVVADTDLHEQFYSAEAMLVAHLRRVLAAAAVPQDGQYCVRPNLGVVLVPSVFGLDPDVPHDAMPRLRAHLNKDQVKRFRLPQDVSQCGLVRRAIEYINYFHQVLQGRVHVYVPDTQGAFDIAHLIFGNAIFYELYDDPEFVHQLLDLCLEAYVQVTIALKHALDEPLESGYHGHGMVAGIYMASGGARSSEDAATLLRPQHIDEFVIPYLAKALRAFGGGFVHYCGRNDHLFRTLLALPEVRGINLGNPEMHDPAYCVRALQTHGKFYFGSWPRLPGETLRSYLKRMLHLTGAERKGMIFLLTPRELGRDSPEEAIRLWRELQEA